MSHKIIVDITEFSRLWNEGYTNTEIQQLLGLSQSKTNKIIRELGLKRSPEQIIAVRKREMERKYGNSNPMLVPEIRERQERTVQEKYGATCSLLNPDIRQKAIATLKEHYGVENPGQSAVIQSKVVATNLAKFGVERPSQNIVVRQKGMKTCKEVYGGNGPMSSAVIRTKSEETCLKRYGVRHIFQSPEVRSDAQQTMKDRYGAECALAVPEFQAKRKDTMIKRYGNSSTLNTPCLRQTVQRTITKQYQERYGVEEEIENVSQLHLRPEVLQALSNREKFREYIQHTGLNVTSSLSEHMGISITRLDKALNEFDSWDLIETFESRAEQEIAQMLGEWGVQVYKTRHEIHPYEIDIYCPDYRIGIEFNGNYWHSDLKKDKGYHLLKSQLAEEKGIFLYHIFEYEWCYKRNKIIAQLRNLFLKNKIRIFGRQCKIREVDSKEAQAFLELNHLQGKDKSSYRIGLYYKEELVSLMTFCKPRFNQNYDWELSRFCSKAGCNVVGGASKLFKAALRVCKGKIISYSNVAKTRGALYGALGFTFLYNSAPSYVWGKGTNDIKTRYQCQMKDEDKQMREQGYFRIYDCGTKVWSYIND